MGSRTLTTLVIKTMVIYSRLHFSNRTFAEKKQAWFPITIDFVKEHQIFISLWKWSFLVQSWSWIHCRYYTLLHSKMMNSEYHSWYVRKIKISCSHLKTKYYIPFLKCFYRIHLILHSTFHGQVPSFSFSVILVIHILESLSTVFSLVKCTKAITHTYVLSFCWPWKQT